ncbi:hypothetical protein IL992_04245 [Microbispora sp. NEAU-D428]|nr:hypothetical protein [Microbispora sitophila]
MPAQETPLHVVSHVLGHASIAITKDVYGHLMEGDKRAATARGLTIYAATMIALFTATIGQGEEIREAAAHALQNPDGETRQVRPGPFAVKFLLVLGAEILLLSLVFPDF